MNKKIRKEANIMTNVLLNAENIIDTYEEKKDVSSKKPSRIEYILLYFKVKQVTHGEYAKELVNKHIIKDKTINSGRATIRGTRVTPEDIGRVLVYKDNVKVKDILDEYPSLTNEEEVLAGLIYFIDKHVSLKQVLFNK